MFAVLSSQYKTAWEWEVSTYTGNIGVRARISDCHIKSITSGTHLITHHTLPRWPCNSIGG
jgi:hypothetical protein